MLKRALGLFLYFAWVFWVSIVYAQNLHYLPDLIVENENSKKKNERSTTKEMDIERSTRNDEEASDDEQTSNEGYNRDDNQSSKRPTPEIEGNVLQSTIVKIRQLVSSPYTRSTPTLSPVISTSIRPL